MDDLKPMVFTAHIPFLKKLKLLFGWHIQIRVCGSMVHWYVTRGMT